MPRKTSLRFIALAVAALILVALTFYITLTFLLGRVESVVLPDLVGMELMPALERLSQLGVNARVEHSELSEIYPEGVIMGQRPYPGRHIKLGRTVMLAVSKGLQKAHMLHLLGYDLAVAQNYLSSNGLASPRLLYACSNEAVANKVIGQYPAPGANAPHDVAVALVISRGACRDVLITPNYVNSLASAAMLDSSRFAIDVVQEPRLKHRSRGALEDKIIDQEPPAGQLLLGYMPYGYQGAHSLRLGVPLGYHLPTSSALQFTYVPLRTPFGFASYDVLVRGYLTDLTPVERQWRLPSGASQAVLIPMAAGFSAEVYLDQQRTIPYIDW